jgi:hypothetical protein
MEYGLRRWQPQRVALCLAGLVQTVQPRPVPLSLGRVNHMTKETQVVFQALSQTSSALTSLRCAGSSCQSLCASTDRNPAGLCSAGLCRPGDC